MKFTVSGNSMTPVFNDGDIVETRKKKTYKNGDYVVAECWGTTVIKEVADITDHDCNLLSKGQYNCIDSRVYGRVPLDCIIGVAKKIETE